MRWINKRQEQLESIGYCVLDGGQLSLFESTEKTEMPYPIT